MANLRFNWGLVRRTQTGLESLAVAEGLLVAVNREGDSAIGDELLFLGKHADDIRIGDKGFYSSGPAVAPYVVLDQENIAAGTVLNFRVEYDVVTLTPAERLDLCSGC